MTSLCQDCGRNEYGCDCVAFKTSLSWPTVYGGEIEDTDLVRLRMNKPAITLLIVALEELRHQRTVRGSKEGGVLIRECDDVLSALSLNVMLMARFVPEGE
jgi:hypothetical protein